MMRFIVRSIVWLTLWIPAIVAVCSQDGGMSYCNQVDAITYTNWGFPGTYRKVVSMEHGKCTSSPHSFSGGMSPLDGEISWHFRGPLRLKQFAFYVPGKSVKRGNSFLHHRRSTHNHGHGYLHDRTVDDAHHATHDTWHDRSVAEQEERQMLERRNSLGVVSATNTTSAGHLSVTTPSSTAAVTDIGTGKWGRQGYYNAEQNSASGLVFLNNKGGSGSGVWDKSWGNSLSYASADGLSGASSAQKLNDILLPDNNEFSIFTSRLCNSNDSTVDDCGFVRPGTVAYHGFSGPSKLFLLEFSMPLSGKTGFNADMPALWILNAQIPRTLQYGDGDCSCWKTGCGEWDVFEVLTSGNTKCITAFHGAKGRSMGSPDWFSRPTGKTIKIAVWLDAVGNQGVVSKVPDDIVFGDVLEESRLLGWLGQVDLLRKKSQALPSV